MKTETKRTSQHSDLPFEIKDPKRHLKPKSDMCLTSTDLLYHLSIKRFFQKPKSDNNLSQCLIFEKLICQSSLFKFRHLTVQCLRNLHIITSICHIVSDSQHYETNVIFQDAVDFLKANACYSDHYLHMIVVFSCQRG